MRYCLSLRGGSMKSKSYCTFCMNPGHLKTAGNRGTSWSFDAKKKRIKNIYFSWRNLDFIFRTWAQKVNFQWKMKLHRPPPHAVSQTTTLMYVQDSVFYLVLKISKKNPKTSKISKKKPKISKNLTYLILKTSKISKKKQKSLSILLPGY